MQNVLKKRFTILGAGRSGLAAARLLNKHGATVLLADANKDLCESSLPKQLNDLQITWEFGPHSSEVLNCDAIILSPGIPMSSSIVKKAQEKNIPIYSEIECASWFAGSPVIAVTGSNGKTTTTLFITSCLKNSGRDAVACGNVGFPFCQAIMDAEDQDRTPIYVCEISSFQLETTYSLKPESAVLLNITPDHLDRYPSFKDYAKTKCSIFNNQNANNISVINVDDPIVMKYAHTKGQIRPISTEQIYPKALAYCDADTLTFNLNGHFTQIPRSDIRLFGPHNDYNMIAGITACTPFISEAKGIIETLKHFSSLPHRLEFIREISGISFFNDSKATNTDSVIMALRGIKSPKHLILGGRDKDNDFSLLAPHITSEDHIYLIGEASLKIAHQLSSKTMTSCGDLQTAVNTAYANAQVGEVILLSPACASFDQYKNFEVRGEHFRQLAESLMEK